MHVAAGLAQVPPSRISFVGVRDLLQRMTTAKPPLWQTPPAAVRHPGPERLAAHVEHVHRTQIGEANRLLAASSGGEAELPWVKTKSRYPRKNCSHRSRPGPTAVFDPPKRAG